MCKYAFWGLIFLVILSVVPSVARAQQIEVIDLRGEVYRSRNSISTNQIFLGDMLSLSSRIHIHSENSNLTVRCSNGQQQFVSGIIVTSLASLCPFERSIDRLDNDSLCYASGCAEIHTGNTGVR